MKIHLTIFLLLTGFVNNVSASICTPEVNDKKVLVEIISGGGEIIYSEKLKIRKKSKYSGLVFSPEILKAVQVDGSKNIKIGKAKKNSEAGGKVIKIKKSDGTALALIGGCPVPKIKILTDKKKGKKRFVHSDVIRNASKASGVKIVEKSIESSSGKQSITADNGGTTICTPEVNDNKVLVEFLGGSGETIYSEKLKVRNKSKYSGLVFSPEALKVVQTDGSKNIKIGKTKKNSEAGGKVTKVKKSDGTALALIGGCPISKINILTGKKKGKKRFLHSDVIEKATKVSGIKVVENSVGTSAGKQNNTTETSSTDISEGSTGRQSTLQQSTVRVDAQAENIVEPSSVASREKIESIDESVLKKANLHLRPLRDAGKIQDKNWIAISVSQLKHKKYDGYSLNYSSSTGGKIRYSAGTVDLQPFDGKDMLECLDQNARKLSRILFYEYGEVYISAVTTISMVSTSFRASIAQAAVVSCANNGGLKSKHVNTILAGFQFPISGVDPGVISIVDKTPIVNPKDGYAFIKAAETGNLPRVRALLEIIGDVDYTPSGGTTALVWASSSGHLEVVKFLIGKGANVNSRSGYDDGTALHGASGWGHIDVVKFLVANGADIKIKTKNAGLSATTQARAAGQKEIEEFLLAKGGNFSDEAIQKQVAEINAEVMSNFYGVLKKPKANEYIKKLSRNESDIKDRLRGEHYRIVSEAENQSPKRCVTSVTEGSFGSTTSNTTCLKTVKKGLEVIHERSKRLSINREELSRLCNTELNSKFCACLVDSLDGHFTKTQYELFLQSPRAFAAHIASYPEDEVRYNSGSVLEGLRCAKRGKCHDNSSVWIPSRVIFRECR